MTKVNAQGIPKELSLYRQWVCWKYEQEAGRDKPTKVPYNPKTNGLASSIASHTWSTLTECLNALDRYDGIGFILTDKDPYCVMDCDATLNEEDYARFVNYYTRLNSFTEISPSGTGSHIWIKGSVPRGRNVRPFEIYSSVRFITVTGNIHYNTDIQFRQNEIEEIWNELGAGKSTFTTHDGLADPVGTDQQLVDMAQSAKNGYKFQQLWHGNYSEWYASQSEADFALIDILAYYSQNTEQLMRVFRASALGKRDKAQRDKYLIDTINKAYDRLPPKLNLDMVTESIDGMLAEYLAASPSTKLDPDEPSTHQLVSRPDVPSPLEPDHDTTIGASTMVDPRPAIAPVQEDAQPHEIALARAPLWGQGMNPTDILEGEVYFPQGVVGDIAEFIYRSSPRPVKEIALTAAIGLMAGICGAAYNVSASGLNQYVILLANTGTGKEAISSGINKLMSRVRALTPSADKFIGASQIASPQALLKHMASKSRCSVSIIGEAGIWLKTMSDPNAPAHVDGLRRLLLELYGRSGRDATLQPAIYADDKKNTDVIRQPALSIIGESTPSRFFEQISDSLIAEGFIPRWLMIEYTGNRVPYNESHASCVPSPLLLQSVSALVQHVHAQMETYSVTDVGFADEAIKTKVKEFNIYCDSQINGSNEDSIRDLWTRTYLKALRLAALIAVGRNPMTPLINDADWDFARFMALKDTLRFCRQFAGGFALLAANSEVAEQERAIKNILRVYLTEKLSDKSMMSYGVTEAMHSRYVVPYSYIHRRLARHKAFTKSRRGASVALKQVITDLEMAGVLVAVPASQASTEFNTSGKLYAVIDIVGILGKNKD